MAIRNASDFLIINGVRFPVPRYGMEIVHSQVVDSGRNANGTVVGQLVGRKLWKLNNLEWVGLDQETWKEMKQALAPFFVKVKFLGDDGRWHNITMYPSDVTGQPLFLENLTYTQFVSCKFNLIDCGKPEED